MARERQSAIKLLKVMTAASVVLPIVLFSIAAWLDYQNFMRITNERMERSLDILQEHSLKVLLTIERTLGEVREIIRGMSDDDIRANEVAVHERLKQIVSATPEMQGILIIDRNGHPIAFSNSMPVPKTVDLSNASYFRSAKDGARGIHANTANVPPLGGPGRVISLAQPRLLNEVEFNGIILVTVLPSYFEKFYQRLAVNGSYFALLLTDGRFLARYPVVTGEPQLSKTAELLQRITRGDDQSLFWATSEVDHVTRLMGSRWLQDFPIYVVAGVNSSAIFHEWLRYNIGYLIFSLPLFLFLFLGLSLALRRTRLLYEYQRQLIAELDHRVKNVLAQVAVMASSTRQGSRSIDDFLGSFDGRIQGMAIAHTLLSEAGWQSVNLGMLVRNELAPYATDSNVTIGGPNVLLNSAETQALARVLHELATNAAKHGALSIPGGRVSVNWDLKLKGALTNLTLVWRELGGPPVASEHPFSYGTNLIRDLIPHELGGTVDLAFAKEGVNCRIEIPISQA